MAKLLTRFWPIFSSQNHQLFVKNQLCNARNMSGGKLSPALKRKMDHFQKDDGIPIYLKGGFGDRVLFMATAGMCVMGAGWSYFTLLSMAFAKKK